MIGLSSLDSSLRTLKLWRFVDLAWFNTRHARRSDASDIRGVGRSCIPLITSCKAIVRRTHEFVQDALAIETCYCSKALSVESFLDVTMTT